MSDVMLEQHNSTTLRLRFTAPFTLLGVPINFYSIQITSADLHTNKTRMISGTEFFYEPPDICTSYSFEIAAWNAVGKGDNTSVDGTLDKGTTITHAVHATHSHT